MKTALYLEDGILQLVITPETEFERDSIDNFSDEKLKVEIMAGSFYACQGGWIRLKPISNHVDTDEISLILKIDKNNITKGDPTNVK